MSNGHDRIFWYPGHELLLPDIVRTENCSLYDSKGRRYVDLESGVWCTSIGHGHPRIVKVMQQQASAFAHGGFNYTSTLIAEVADEILRLLGLKGGRCTFLCSGSEAVEYGVRVARMTSDRTLFLTMADSYFGAYGSAAQRSSEEWHSFDWFPCADCPHDGECGPECELLDSVPFERIGGFLLEPGSSSGLVRFPPRKLVHEIVRRVRSEGGLILVNEVTTGIGRTGKWFGYQHYDFEPDVVAMGKGIGNGYPVAVAAFSNHVIERLGDEPVKYAQSHQNDPLGAAVAREVLRVIDEDRLVERSSEIGARLSTGLGAIAEASDLIAEVRSRGLMQAVELKTSPNHQLTVDIHHSLLDRGFVVGRRPDTDVLRLDPSLTVAQEDIDDFLEVFDEIVRKH